MTIPAARPLRPTPPASVVACRVLVGIQGALAALATAMAGIVLMFLVTVTFAADGWQRSYTAPVLLVGSGIVLSFVQLAALTRLRRGENGVRRAIIGVELALAAILTAFLLTSTAGEPAAAAAPLLDLACCVLVVGVLATPAAREWTEVQS